MLMLRKLGDRMYFQLSFASASTFYIVWRVFSHLIR
jgi:hypothetical protein